MNLKKVLVVEHNKSRRENIVHFLSALDLKVESVPSISEAAVRLSDLNHISLVIASLVPSEPDNTKILQKFKAKNPNLAVVILSNPENPETAISLLEKEVVDHIASADNLAAIFSAVKNEFTKRTLITKNRSYVQNLKKLKLMHQRNIKRALDLEETYDTTLENLMTALDLRDVETFGHSRTVAKYSQVLAKILNITEKNTLDNIRKGALLHDIGKIAIPDSILKKPGPLSSQEWEKIKLHPSIGYGLIKEIKLVKEVGNIILCHHERFDGKGYPNQLKEKEIPLEARIFALADALDAITSHRPYREKRDFKAAKEEIMAHSRTQFDPEVVDAFNSLDLRQWEKIRFETTELMQSFQDMIGLSRIENIEI